MQTIYFDSLCGASGDMILASLIGCGVPLEYLQRELDRTGLPGLVVQTRTVMRGGVACLQMHLEWEPSGSWRHLPRILEIIEQPGYPPRVVERCRDVLQRIANAEARVHGIPVEQVHFHELGAVDTIIDVLGAALCLEFLEIGKVTFSTLTDGHGTIVAEHGVMPVPAPATAAMLEGFRLRTLDIGTELLTPTGCGILTALGTQLESGPQGRVVKIGCGCGTREFANHPNYLRAILMETEAAANACDQDRICVLMTNLDHISGEIMGFTTERLLEAGALDVAWVPAFMKKNRPGYILNVQCSEADRSHMTDIIMANTRTLGVRHALMHRTLAQRSPVDARLDGDEVAAKSCSWQGRTFTKIEYDAAAALARQRGVPLVEILDRFCREQG